MMQVALPGLSSQGRALLKTLMAVDCRLDTADRVARGLGLADRFCLARVIRREGLPSFRDLTDWIATLELVWQGETSGKPLLQLVKPSGDDPATWYRRVRRTLGVPWR